MFNNSNILIKDCIRLINKKMKGSMDFPSKRESEILKLLVKGNDNNKIAKIYYFKEND